MNKILSIAAIVALVTTLSFAQEEEKEGAKFGVRAGFNLYDLTGKGSGEIDMGLGGGGGIVINIPINNFFSFSPELNFSYRRLYDNNEKYEEQEIKEEQIYESEFAISILAMLQVTPDKGPLYMAIGVQLDVPISPEVTKKISYSDGKSDRKTRDFDDRATTDFGIALGLGFNATQHFRIDLRCVAGLTDLVDEYEGDAPSFNQYGIGITYFF